MNPVLVKIFATALALSQVTTQPDAAGTQFDLVQDQAAVTRLLQRGCDHIRKVFDIESISLDDLITTAMNDPQAMTAGIKALNGVSFEDLFTAYRQFCKNETVPQSPVDLGEVIAYFNKAATDLPDDAKLKDLKLPGLSTILDNKGERLAEVGEPARRRVWVPLGEIPARVQQAFVSAEDKRFYQHHGVDERGMIRAFAGNLAKSGRPQGGSTITQQVVKNLLTGDDATYDRKIREIILASRLERALSKSEILALYLNFIYLGRGSWGIETAAQSYFGKPASALTLPEGALLAGLTKGPNTFSPDRHPERARERQTYVLNRMQEDGAISSTDAQEALAQTPDLVAYDPVHRDAGLYFADQVVREAKSDGGIDLRSGADAYTVHATMQADLQRATEAALQDGLARYETETSHARFQGAEANVADAVQQIEAERKSTGSVIDVTTPAWQEALERARLPLYDVHWDAAVVIPGSVRKSSRRGDGVRVGLRDGRVVPLTSTANGARRILKPYDVVFVRLSEEGRRKSANAELLVRPSVQGAAVVLENKTGRILAMTGGFSHAESQLNRVTQTRRQPGSTLKPLSYLAALEAGLQPNTLVRDDAITLGPINGPIHAREEDYWSPKNYDRGRSGVLTLRRALESSKNRVTARLLEGGIAPSPEQSLDRVCEIAQDAQLYRDCRHYYPFVLGAQSLRMIDLAAFYAAIANEGARPTPHVIDSIEKDGQTIYHRDPELKPIGHADPATFYQLKTILQGVVERGTARAISELAPYVAGKTGTTEDENDAWFVGFTNDVTIAVWVGYDNADGQRRTLGSGQTGAKVALPIFQEIVQAAWDKYAPRTPLSPPSEEARRQLVDIPIDLSSGDRLSRSRKGFVEHFRRRSDGDLADTQHQLVSRRESVVRRQKSERFRAERRGTTVTSNGDSISTIGSGAGLNTDREWGQTKQPPSSPPSSSGQFCLFCASGSSSQ
jgi:penicillin-binding protein 1A